MESYKRLVRLSADSWLEQGWVFKSRDSPGESMFFRLANSFLAAEIVV